RAWPRDGPQAPTRSQRPRRSRGAALGVVGVGRGPEMAPKPPRVRGAPAEPWRCSGVVGVRARPGDGPQAPTRSQRRGGAVALLWSGGRRAWPRDGPEAPTRSQRPGGAVALLWARQPRQTHQAKRATMTAATATWAAAPMTIPTSVPSPARTLSPSGRAHESSPRIAPATGPATRPIGAVNRPT